MVVDILIETLVLVLSGSLRLFATLNAGALVVFLFSEVRHNSGLRAASLKSFESAVQRFVLFNAYF